MRMLVLALLPLLAACGVPERQARVDDDPMMAEALEDQLMVDPDLSQQNYRNYAIVPPGPVDRALPSRNP
ncbi:MAG: hypothetical protein RIS94_1678 [Pseudomonadota bacterium]|jgi:hypothetical protein